ncbi:DnaJ-class molecular chaperone with C-terminal Zn finger domain [Nostoc sp. PCC 7524]|uniref:J domain-containing protein n=1 Tax=Nostoc sp. (strain ATCC 29411 / PCC 7524) TaxID=28072 RepID=UPI00029EF489|nr:J domain-containing protein [Nostoc sp. PCC 7524]AFY47115.1 DnaJ-class molecular chaperone with C-terminal Zn finger domain [Nostoc sp. PCC 7524]
MDGLEQYYQILEISTDASVDEIKQAYRDLAQIWHPDRYAYNPKLQQKAEAKFKSINVAYEKLMEHFEECTSNDFANDVQPDYQAHTNDESSNEDEGMLTKFVKGLFKLTLKDQLNLESDIKRFSSVFWWKAERLAAVGTPGAITGAIGGPVGLAAIPPELVLCERNATIGAFGIGHLLGCHIDYNLDREIILAIWAGEGTLETRVPAGKVGIKINNKAPSASASRGLMGAVITSSLIKGSAKFLAKLSAKLISKAVAKISAKIAAKTGGAAIPVLGGFISGGTNVWLVEGFMDAAEQFYSAQNMSQAVYLVLKDNQLISDL